MKILHVTDLHGELPWYQWLAREAHKFDLVCLSGDLIHLDDSASRQIAEVTRVLREIRTPLAICSGNHDTVHAQARDEGAYWVSDLKREGVWVDGDRFELGGRKFYCHPWNEPFPSAQADEIWIVHTPPEWSVVSWGGNYGEVGDHEFAQLCRAMRGPKIVLCGHAHTPPAWSAMVGRTQVFNPGDAAGESVPAHIVLELSLGVAHRHYPGRPQGLVPICPVEPRDILRKRSPEELERLIDLTVQNRKAEGHVLTVDEIAEVRRRLRKLAFGEE
jgi:Icc-related predicted phosphoesterase